MLRKRTNAHTRKATHMARKRADKHGAQARKNQKTHAHAEITIHMARKRTDTHGAQAYRMVLQQINVRESTEARLVVWQLVSS